MKKLLGFIVVLFALLFLVPEQELIAVTKTLTPSADTFLNANLDKVYTNYGSNAIIRIRMYPNYFHTILVKFDLSTIPAGKKILSAKLRMYQELNLGDPDIVATSIQMYPVLFNWNENTVTWTNRPARGGKIDPPSGSGSEFILEKTENAYQEWDITNTVQDWMDAVAVNYGLYFETTVNNWYSNFSSKEGANPPQLVVEYENLVLEYHLPSLHYIPDIAFLNSPTPTNAQAAVPTAVPTSLVRENDPIVSTPIPTIRRVFPTSTLFPTLTVAPPIALATANPAMPTIVPTGNTSSNSSDGQIVITTSFLYTVLKLVLVAILVVVILKKVLSK